MQILIYFTRKFYLKLGSVVQILQLKLAYFDKLIMTEIQPMITVGIPVYNGDQYIKKAINSVLTQSYSNFELIISDNGSTDSTKEICEKLAIGDNRIRYVRHQINKGVDFNFSFILSESRTKYFVWLAADDYWESTFLEKNLEILEINENVVGSIGLVKFYGVKNFHIKKNFVYKIKNKIKRGNNKEYEKYEHVRPVSGDYEKKASTYLRFDQSSFVYGLFRTEKLRKRRVSADQVGWDLIMILNILKEGDLFVVDEVLLYRFVSGVHSRSGYLGSYKKNILPLIGLILPSSNIAYWCLKNIGKKFFLKNLDWFVLLVIYGWFTVIQELKTKN